MAKFLLVTMLVICSCGVCYGKGMPEMIHSVEDIMPVTGAVFYNKMIPPKVDGKPALVFFHATLINIDFNNENSMAFNADIFLAQSWKDHRLRIPTNMTEEYRILDWVLLDHLWRPDVFFRNAKEVNFQMMAVPNHYLWLYKDTTIMYMMRVILTLSCPMNLAIYPHDTQNCKMQMESLSNDKEDLIFSWDQELPFNIDEGIELPNHLIVGNKTNDCSKSYSTGNFSCLEVEIQVKRRWGHFLFFTYIPVCLMVIMSWVSFWLQPEMTFVRMMVVGTALITLASTQQHISSQDSLPTVAYIKVIDVFISSCTLYILMALMENVYVSFLVTGRWVNGDVIKDPDNLNLTKRRYKAKEGRRRVCAIGIDGCARFIFPISFTGLICIYWITIYIMQQNNSVATW